mgnify:CR=1|tara:strand:+ start:345 stop:662 length:318 start_codon:yes stop_codon:yes gene_type:complete
MCFLNAFFLAILSVSINAVLVSNYSARSTTDLKVPARLGTVFVPTAIHLAIEPSTRHVSASVCHVVVRKFMLYFVWQSVYLAAGKWGQSCIHAARPAIIAIVNDR